MPGAREHKVHWTQAAAGDLDALLDYMAQDSPDAALQVSGRIRQAAGRLKFVPLRGRVVPELRDQGIVTYRELVVPPWRVIYRVDASLVLVLAVFDGRRDIEDILLARFLRS